MNTCRSSPHGHQDSRRQWHISDVLFATPNDAIPAQEQYQMDGCLQVNVPEGGEGL